MKQLLKLMNQKVIVKQKVILLSAKEYQQGISKNLVYWKDLFIKKSAI